MSGSEEPSGEAPRRQRGRRRPPKAEVVLVSEGRHAFLHGSAAAKFVDQWGGGSATASAVGPAEAAVAGDLQRLRTVVEGQARLALPELIQVLRCLNAKGNKCKHRRDAGKLVLTQRLGEISQADIGAGAAAGGGGGSDSQLEEE